MSLIVTPEVEKWDGRYLDIARTVSTWSKDPSTQTGAVIVDCYNRLVSVGYNGFARGVDDSPERYANRELKYKMIVHCERNAMLCTERDLFGYTLYTWPFMSCAPCAAMVIQSGIYRCVAPENNNERWVADFEITMSMFEEAGVELTLYQGLL